MSLKDSYIGLIRKASTIDTSPIITRCNIQVEELSDENGIYRSLTNALVNITNLDIISNNNLGITKIKVEAGYIKNSESELLTANNNLPGNWTILDTINIAENPGLTGSDNRLSFLIKNISTHPSGYYYKFKFTFLDKDDVPARLIPTFLMDSSVYAGTYSDNEFTVTDNPVWLTDELAGFSVLLKDSADNSLFTDPVPICSNTEDTLLLMGGVQLSLDKNASETESIEFIEVTSYYVLGDTGLGKKFNGINDMAELVGVPEVFAETSSNTWVEPQTGTPVALNKNKIKLKFTNCYNRIASNLTNGLGQSVSVSNKQFLFVSGYAIYMFISNASDLPSDGYYPGSDAETNGEWFKITEIDDIHINPATMPYYEYIVGDLPLGKNIMFWVGVYTPNTKTTLRSMKTVEAI